MKRIGYAVQIPPLYRERLRHDETKFSEMVTTLRETCGWLNDYAQDTTNNKDKVMEDFEKTKDDMDAAFATIQQPKQLLPSIIQ